jgi:hypothetical protein
MYADTPIASKDLQYLSIRFFNGGTTGVSGCPREQYLAVHENISLLDCSRASALPPVFRGCCRVRLTKDDG